MKITQADIVKARAAANLINEIDGQAAYRALWNALDEPTREEMLTWFREWDLNQDAWNPPIINKK